LKLKNKI